MRVDRQFTEFIDHAQGRISTAGYRVCAGHKGIAPSKKFEGNINRAATAGSRNIAVICAE